MPHCWEGLLFFDRKCVAGQRSKLNYYPFDACIEGNSLCMWCSDQADCWQLIYQQAAPLEFSRLGVNDWIPPRNPLAPSPSSL